MRVQVVDVVFLRSRVYDAHLHGITDIAVVNVRRIIRVQNLRGFAASDQVAELVSRVGRYVRNLRRIADGPRRQEELFILALGAIEHWSNAEAVGQNLGADTGGAVVDRELVFDAVQRVTENGIVKLRKRLHVLNFIVIDHGELAERLVAIRGGGVGRIGAGWEASFGGASDDGVQVGVNDRIDIEHLQDRLPSLGMSHRVHSVVIDDRLTARSRAGFGQVEIRCGYLRAIPLGAFLFDVDAAEQTFGECASIAFATGRSGRAVHQVVSFTRCVEGVDGRTARSDRLHLLRNA